MESTPSGAMPAIVLDCDPGHDDALAIVAAARYTHLLGITTVAGNASLERTTHNARVLRDLLGLDVEVHAGAARPLLQEPTTAPFIHGASGLDGAELPPPVRPLDSHDAVSFLIETCRAHEGTFIVATGPLTNVALALRAAPDLAERIAGIALMGGGRFGNRTPVAEFNIWADPEAAAIVFGASPFGDRPLLMAGLDVTHQFVATEERIARVELLGGRLATMLAGLMRFYAAAYHNRTEPKSLDGPPMHDPLAVLALTHPHLFVDVDRHVTVETSGALTRGMTVIDERPLVDRPAANCRVLTTIDAENAFALLLEAIATFTSGDR